MVWIVGIGVGLVLLFAFPKQMGAVILLLVLGAVGLFLAISNAEQNRAEEHRRKVAAITLSATHDITSCSAEYPILLTIRNGYNQTIQTLNFNLAGFREGFSSAVYEGSSYRSDRIIPPGGSYVACWTLPPLKYGAQEVPAAGLTWRASYAYAAFGNAP